MPRVILAAGHGGGDSGAVGQGTTEAAEVIDIVNRAADMLRADGQLEVVVVPHELNLVPTIQWINDRFGFAGNVAIEVHKNSFGGPAHGVETWYFGGDQASAKLAQKIQDQLLASGLVNRGIKPDTSNRHGSLGFIRQTTPAAVLVEMGFISNGGDPVGPGANAHYASALSRAALAVFGLVPRPITPPAPQPTPTPAPSAKYRVLAGDKQIGAYNTESGAWNKFTAEGGTKIVGVTGDDLTPVFVAKFRPVVPQPAPGAEPHPTLEERVRALEKLVKTMWDYLSKWIRFQDFVNKQKGK